MNISSFPLSLFPLSTNGEDPNCSDSLEPWQYEPADHELYLGFNQRDGDAYGCNGFEPWQ